MDSIIVYYTIIILSILNKVGNYIELRVVKDWLIKLKVDRLVLLKCYFCFFKPIQYMLYIMECFYIMQDILSQYCKI